MGAANLENSWAVSQCFNVDLQYNQETSLLDISKINKNTPMQKLVLKYS